MVVPVTEGTVGKATKPLGRSLASALERRARATEFRGRPDDVLAYEGERTSALLIGLGDDGAATSWLRLGARARREAERLGARRVVVWLGAYGARPLAVTNLALGFLLAGYRFDRYRSEPRRAKAESLAVVSEALPPPAEARALLADVTSLAAGVFGARDLVNEPPSVATPLFLASCAKQLAAGSPTLHAEVWGPDRMAREGLTGSLAVSRGSAEQPRFVMLRHAPARAKRRIAIVGKGITFDSGGLSLKPAKSMETMKYDMAGGSAALHAVSVAAALKLPVEVTAYVPAAENLPGGRAQKPGDVIRYANGKTVEVLNTDAEGRLVLADALAPGLPIAAGRHRRPGHADRRRAHRARFALRLCARQRSERWSISSWPRRGRRGRGCGSSRWRASIVTTSRARSPT